MKTDVVAQHIKKLYNEQKTDSIYALTDTSFRKAISFKALQNALLTQLYPYGKITKMDFERSKDSVNIYKTYLGTAVVVNLIVGLNKEGKVKAFGLQPYKAEVKETDKRKIFYHDNALLSRIDSLVHESASGFMETTKSPGLSIGILVGTKSYYYNYGEAKKDEDIHPTRNTVYEIGSVTKTFTAWLLADAVVNNKMALDDPITKYLPDSVAANKDLQKITIAQLSNHSSGMPRLPGNAFEGLTTMNDPYSIYDDKLLFSYLKKYKATRKPGEKYEYSNLAVGLLGVIMERVNQLPLETQYSQAIFSLLKMKSSYATAIKDSSITALGYDANAKTTGYWNFKSMTGAGAIKSTAEDLIKYAVPFALMPMTKGKYDARVLLLQQITFNQEPNIVSLGWHFDTEDKTRFIMTHSGGTGGFRSNISIMPSKRLAVVVLNNSAEEPGAPIVGKQLMDALTKWVE
ncbi:MAG: serine hydrolase domain-containing protein [Bacteroidota bacterium]